MSIKNKRIYAIAPSGTINKEKFSRALTYLEKNDNTIEYSEQVFQTFRNMAGNDKVRLEALLEALCSHSDLVWAIRGGYGALRILAKIPKDLKIDTNTILIGYSDITAYQLLLYKYYNLKSISSHMIQVDLPLKVNKETDHFVSLIEENDTRLKLPKSVDILKMKETNGIILGGCLSIISKMIGTEYLPSLENKILFLEDVNEEHYKIDGYLAHLKNAGLLKDLNGIIFGKFRISNKSVHQDLDISDLISEFFDEYDYPIVNGLAFGHIENMIAMPIGYYCQIKERELIFSKNEK